MYVCGITPYDATHLGHAATYVTYDILQRRLLDLGHEVRYVRNITDVDDDLLRAAEERGVHYLDLAFGEIARFDDDMAALNTLPPWSEPRATGVIANIRGLIDTLLTQGDAYLVDGAVYFDTGAANASDHSPARHDRMRQLAAEWGRTIRPSATRSISCCGVRATMASRRGRRWGRGRPGWRIDAAPSPCVSWDPRSTSMAVVSISSSHYESCRAQSKRSRANRSSGMAAPGDGALRWAQDVEVDRQSVFVGDLRERHDAARPARAVVAPLSTAGIGATISSPTPRRSLGGVRPVPAMLRSMPPGEALADDLDTPTALAALDAAAEWAGNRQRPSCSASNCERLANGRATEILRTDRRSGPYCPRRGSGERDG